MSNTVTSIAKRKVIGSSARKAVLMYMADNASDDGSGIWTSKSNMAADLEMSKRTVQAHIQAMVEMGVIFEVGYRQCKNGFTVEYAINLEALSALKGTRAGDAPVQEMHPYPCSTCTPTRAGDAPKPPLEPPLEPNCGPTAMPDGWFPDQAKAESLIEKYNLIPEELNLVFKRMKDECDAKNRRYKNWNLAFANWVGKSVEWGNIGPGSKFRHNATQSSGSAFD